MAWEYKREEAQFKQLPEGDYRIRIRSAEKAISKKGSEMLALQFEVSGSTQILYHYIVFMEDRPEMTNRLLTQFYDSFEGIPEGNMDMRTWIGRVGACKVKHDDDGRARIHYFLSGKRAEALPPWKDLSGATVDKDGFMNVPDAIGDDLPDFD